MLSFYAVAQPPRRDTRADTAIRSVQLDEAVVAGKLATTLLQQQPYAIDVVDVGAIRGQNAALNRLLDRVPGVRVRETGGLGSDASYTIHGLSGKSVKFFIDGIPAEQLGGAFGISNFPVNTVERIEVYKGVVPVHLSSDALGGAINIVTRQDPQPYLDLSYAYGSFNTHRAAVSGKWYHTASGFTVQGNAFFNRSDNDYRVWGTGVEVADVTGRPIPGFSARRFNDDYTSYLLRTEIGVAGKRWADKLLFGTSLSSIDRGIQTGRTMAFVFGSVRYDEQTVMPSLTYAKTGLLRGKLDVEIYGSYSHVEGHTLDTSSVKYNWEGRGISTGVHGEMGGIYAQKSSYRFRDGTALWRALVTYRPSERQLLRLAYNSQALSRRGSDALALAEWTIPLRFPQHLYKQVAGVAYELNHGPFKHILAAKYYHYRGRSNAYDYVDTDQRELIPVHRAAQDWGLSYAGRAMLASGTLLKASAEQTMRMPDPVELFGDGTSILNAPGLQPERSFNANAAVQHHFLLGGDMLSIMGGLFFRDTKDLIWLGEGTHLGTARYENLSRIRTVGTEASATYHLAQLLEITTNATYQDIRNRQRYTAAGTPNLVYNDRLRNMPSFLASGEVRIKSTGGLLDAGAASLYLSTHYVPEYYLWWPSLGTPSLKTTIPAQFVQDVGVSYRLKRLPCQLTADCHNLFNRQVYDNYLLQKPGRFISMKINYQLTSK
ncbi:Outer membrane receptor proteins, mostly Fe transport [Parapedobacter koreensis]|uniref:Outer membrane receptor proteins, mostly Fe transport n=2 Tax=Parapedobacter koreensis TaxID=332977 RepID=A0A1H7F113_9SPHI|nr:Outer membrane receptor proteins, mostly Fe transport [Parapedobacter koreensis]